MGLTNKSYILAALMTCTVLGCTDSSFSSGGKKKVDEKSAVDPSKVGDPNKTDDSNAANPNPSDTSDSSGPGQVEVKDGEICYKAVPQVNVSIAIDVTGSMANQINTVKTNLTQFVNAVKNIELSGGKSLSTVKVGLIAFDDSIQSDKTQPLVEDLSAVASKIATLRAAGGNDDPEGGLYAAAAATQLLYKETKTLIAANKTAVNILLVITDTFAHDGGGPTDARAYTGKIMRAYMAMPMFSNFLLYTAVPDSKTNFINGVSTTPEGQWADIRNYWKTQHPTITSAPGEHIGNNFDAESFLTILPAAIAKRIKFCN